jgi:hypothetical protein
MASKPTILILGDPKKTIRHQTDKFNSLSSNFNIKVNEDLTRDSFTQALKTKKYLSLVQTFFGHLDLG